MEGGAISACWLLLYDRNTTEGFTRSRFKTKSFSSSGLLAPELIGLRHLPKYAPPPSSSTTSVRILKGAYPTKSRNKQNHVIQKEAIYICKRHRKDLNTTVVESGIAPTSYLQKTECKEKTLGLREHGVIFSCGSEVPGLGNLQRETDKHFYVPGLTINTIIILRFTEGESWLQNGLVHFSHRGHLIFDINLAVLESARHILLVPQRLNPDKIVDAGS